MRCMLGDKNAAVFQPFKRFRFNDKMQRRQPFDSSHASRHRCSRGLPVASSMVHSRMTTPLFRARFNCARSDFRAGDYRRPMRWVPNRLCTQKHFCMIFRIMQSRLKFRLSAKITNARLRHPHVSLKCLYNLRQIFIPANRRPATTRALPEVTNPTTESPPSPNQYSIPGFTI